MKVIRSTFQLVVMTMACVLGFSSCSDSKSYADRLVDENKAMNLYLSNCRVINTVPEDNAFETGPDAPFYRMDEEGNVYMQVIYPGDKENNMAEDDELIFFRFTRYNLLYYYNYGEMIEEGNADDMNQIATSFRFNNTSLSSSTQYGSGIQLPLSYLGIDCQVKLVIKSQYGFSNEIASVTPYLYELRYFKPLSN